MVSYLTPVATLVLAFLILAERPLPLQLVGAAVIAVGVRLAGASVRGGALANYLRRLIQLLGELAVGRGRIVADTTT